MKITRRDTSYDICTGICFAALLPVSIVGACTAWYWLIRFLKWIRHQKLEVNHD